MIEIQTEIPGWVAKIVEHADELPEVPDCQVFFMDFETTLYDKERLAVCHRKNSLGAFFPYSGDRIAGAAVVYGKEKVGYYIPVRHKSGGNIDLTAFQEWLLLHHKIPVWCNANVKFDAHFAVQDKFDYRGILLDCLSSAKVFNVEYPTHALKPLCRNWVGLPMTDVDKVRSWLKEAKTGDYGRLPIDICGEYAVLDCFGARHLQLWIQKHKDEGTEAVYDSERQLTGVLYDMERAGMWSDRPMLLRESRRCLCEMIEAATELYELTGIEYVDSSAHNHNILCTQLGLPVLSYTTKKDKTKGGPSFDAEALTLYLQHPQVKIDPRATEIVQNITKFRAASNFKSMFLDVYLKFMDPNGLLHPSYNQIVRTGRMSCRHPNAQQLNAQAKKLIKPKEGCAFLSFDASQIEFRIIAHYMKDPAVLDAYRNDRATDFHTLVANLVQFEFHGKTYNVTRSQGKTLNFAMAFGAGKRRVTAQLAGDDVLLQMVTEKTDTAIAAGEVLNREQHIVQLCYSLASKVWEAYHDHFPLMKIVSDKAAGSTRWKGYAVNLLGRRRKLSNRRSHIAFNTAVQGSAMDIIKLLMIKLSPRNNEWIASRGIELIANVHDEILFQGPIEVMKDPETWEYINDQLCDSPIPLRVPILWDGGYSEESWYEASKGPVRLSLTKDV